MGLTQPFEHVRFANLDVPACRFESLSRRGTDRGAAIDEHRARASFGPETSRDSEQERAVTCTEFDDQSQRRLCRAHRAHHGARVPHERVDLLQIAARLNGSRIVRRQVIENFGLNVSSHVGRPKGRHYGGVWVTVRSAGLQAGDHSTSSRAPWQLKPAPNEDIHQLPPGACSLSAACSTKYTHGLLTLP